MPLNGIVSIWLLLPSYISMYAQLSPKFSSLSTFDHLKHTSEEELLDEAKHQAKVKHGLPHSGDPGIMAAEEPRRKDCLLERS